MVTIVIPNYNGAHWLRGCLASLEKSTYRDLEVIIVDNASTDESEAVARQARLRLTWLPLDRNYGFAKAVNQGIAASQSAFTLLLNNDTLVLEDFVEKLQAKLASLPPEFAAVQPLMLQMDAPNLVDDAGDSLSWYGVAAKNGHGADQALWHEEGAVFSPSGGASLYRTSFLRQMGGLDESFGSYLEDVDLGLRGQLRGFRFHYCPQAVVLHKGHGSAMPSRKYVRLMTKNRLILFAKNFPLPILFTHCLKLAYGQIFFFTAYGKPVSALLGYLDFFRVLGHTIRNRKAVRSQTVLGPGPISRLLTEDFPKPHLPQLLIDLAYQAWRGFAKKLFK